MVLPCVALNIESTYLEFDTLAGKAWARGLLAVALQVYVDTGELSLKPGSAPDWPATRSRPREPADFHFPPLRGGSPDSTVDTFPGWERITGDGESCTPFVSMKALE